MEKIGITITDADGVWSDTDPAEMILLKEEKKGKRSSLFWLT